MNVSFRSRVTKCWHCKYWVCQLSAAYSSALSLALGPFWITLLFLLSLKTTLSAVTSTAFEQVAPRLFKKQTTSPHIKVLYVLYMAPHLKNLLCTPGVFMPHVLCTDILMEPTTVGSLWLENDLHENELEFESHMGRSKKNVRITSDGIHSEIHKIWTCVAPAAPPLFHAAVNPCLQGESPWNWSCNSVNLRKSTVTWMRWHYVFTVISRHDRHFHLP